MGEPQQSRPSLWLFSEWRQNVVNREAGKEATNVFFGTEVQISTQGRRHLGAALGSRLCVESYVSRCVENLTGELQKLPHIAASHPQAAYTAFVHGVRGKWLFLARTIPQIKDLLQPLDDTLRLKFIPALTGRSAPGELECILLSLPTKLGGLGLTNLVLAADDDYK